MNNNPSLSYAGTWIYANSNHQAALVPFYAIINLGSAQRQGVVLGGWSYAGWTNTTYYDTYAAVLDQQADGTLKLNTNLYLQNPQIQGAGSVLVADFNNDHQSDIAFIAHNESPCIDKASTVFLSTANGEFQKYLLNDTVQAHSAEISSWNGQLTIVSAGYGTRESYYQYDANSGQMVVRNWGNDYIDNNGRVIKSFYASCALLVDLNNDGQVELVVGDVQSAPGYSFEVNKPASLVVYKLNGNTLADSPSSQTNYWFDQYSNLYRSGSDIPTGGLSHNYRLWTDDFNHDGLSDLIAGVGIFSQTSGFQKAKFEMFQNVGALQFKDVSNPFSNGFSEDTNNVDYSMQLEDIDHSGINSYLLGDALNTSSKNNCNYLLVNDGTGQLHVALHDEFMTWGLRVKQLIDQQGVSYNSSFVAPKFIAYLTNDGYLNYLAEWAPQNDQIPFVNVPIQYNLTTDYTQSITITDRNYSTLMRTWAGNDIYCDKNANISAAHIDGGLGMDTSIYSDSLSNYLITGHAGSYEVKYQGHGNVAHVDDTLSNIERLQFSDYNVALDTDSANSAGGIYRLYQAAFDRQPDLPGLGYWIKAADNGKSAVTMAEDFTWSKEFLDLFHLSTPKDNYFTGVEVKTLVEGMYTHVLHRAADSGGLNYYAGVIQSHEKTVGRVLAEISDSPENHTAVASSIANGIQYTPYTAQAMTSLHLIDDIEGTVAEPQKMALDSYSSYSDQVDLVGQAHDQMLDWVWLG